MNEKFFTPREANRILPEVKKIVSEIIAGARQVPVPQDHIRSLMSRLEAMGCHYKDWNFEIGLVDFPAIINGQEALLCWRSDEPEVAWFHGFEDGYAGRRPITRELIFS